MSDARWHYASAGRRYGPVSSTTLRELVATGALGPRDWVWQPGMACWEPASRLEQLLDEPILIEGSLTPPPMPARPSAVVQARRVKADNPEPAGQTPDRTKRSSKRVLIGCLSLLGLFVCCCGGLGILGAFGKRASEEAEQARKREQQIEAQRELASADELWAAGKFPEAFAKYTVLAQPEFKDRLDETQHERVKQRRAEGETRAAVADGDRLWDGGDHDRAVERYLVAHRFESRLAPGAADHLHQRLADYAAEKVRAADRDWQEGRKAVAVKSYRDLLKQDGFPTSPEDRTTMAARISEVEAEEARAELAKKVREAAVTASFYPHKPHSTLTYLVVPFPDDRSRPKTAAFEYAQAAHSGGVISVTTASSGTVSFDRQTPGVRYGLAAECEYTAGKTTNQAMKGKFYRVRGQLVEVANHAKPLTGSEGGPPADSLTWEPVLKIGAKSGETWSFANFTYRVAGFGTHTLAGESKPRLTVTVAQEVRSGEEVQLVSECTYLEHVGLLDRRDYGPGVGGKQEYLARWLLADVTARKMSQVEERAFAERGIEVERPAAVKPTPATGADQPKLSYLTKFPVEYLDKEVRLVVWIDPKGIVENVSIKDQKVWMTSVKDGPDPKGETYGGAAEFLDTSGKVHFVLPSDLAKTLIKELPAGKSSRCEVTATMKRETYDMLGFGRTTVYVLNISEVKR